MAKKNNKMSILIVTESQLLHDSIFTILESFSFVTLVGSWMDKPDYLLEIDRYLPDVVLVECLPNMAWVELIRLIHAGHPEMNCVAITDTYNSGRLALEKGANAVLTQGFTCYNLSRVIRRLSDNNPALDIPIETQLSSQIFVSGQDSLKK